jgi:O-antigen ligase
MYSSITPEAIPSVARRIEARDGAAFLIALLFLLLPAIGMPVAEIMQDTFKSALVASTATGAALMLAMRLPSGQKVVLHPALLLPASLAMYAAISVLWAHPYLAAVEAARWAVILLLITVAINSLNRERLGWLALAIHVGAATASLWVILQFTVDLQWFAQNDSNPGSTFANRNFFAEYAVTALPFSVYAMLHSRRWHVTCLIAIAMALIVVAIMMTGTRSALLTMWLLMGTVLPFAAWRYRRALPAAGWSRQQRIAAQVVFVLTAIILAALPTHNPRIAAEERGTTGFERAITRTSAALTFSDSSLRMRASMWRSTMQVILDHPVTGVGAGNWQSVIPAYEGAQGASLELDAHAHNEYLEIVAEYGLVGCLFLAALGAYLLRSTMLTWRAGPQDPHGPMRATALTSLLALLMVSGAGFPWHMAGTAALLAIAVALLAVTERPEFAHAYLNASWHPSWRAPAAALSAAALGLSAYVFQQASLCEIKLVRATKLAFYIDDAGDVTNEVHAPLKAEVERLAREAIAINPHYRSLTPGLGDEFGKWGDWEQAVFIWESVLEHRPNLVAVLTNTARGYLALQQPDKALTYLGRARAIAPNSVAVRSAEVAMLTNTPGQDAAAARAARAAMASGRVDLDLLSNAFVVGSRSNDGPLTADAARMLQKLSADALPDAYMQLADWYMRVGGSTGRAIAAWQKALVLSSPATRGDRFSQIPIDLRPLLLAASS